jgi:hypothetical protein
MSKGRLITLLAMAAILALAVLVNLVQDSHAAERYNPVVIRAYICAYAIKYHVPPADALAVGHVETRKLKSGQITQEFRTGLIGPKGEQVYGPMGIAKCFKYMGVANVERNIEVGVMTLARYRSLAAALPHYNKKCNRAYRAAIAEARRHYRVGGVS